jgi:organic hydroperoxide reductase OsmC/OhrA
MYNINSNLSIKKMSEHKVKISWQNKGTDFTYSAYDRTHTWEFEGGKIIQASAAPEYMGKIDFINPEEALAAALSSCHMMTFLFVCSKKKYILETYEDLSIAILAKNENNKMAVTQLYLRPKITFKGENQPSKEMIDFLHEKAHEECFIANSVLTKIIIEPIYD